MYDDDVEVNPLQPLRDATDANRAKSDYFGGWERVFEYCQYENFAELFMFNDYVIIQIDTDMGEHANFGVALTYNGADRSAKELVDEVRQRIVSIVDQTIYMEYQSRFNFAIAVHSVECWLLPFYAKEKSHVAKTKNCAKQLERDAHKQGLNFNKEYKTYDTLSKPYQNSRELNKAKQHHQSLALFLDSLPLP